MSPRKSSTIEIRPIKTESDYRWALSEIERLWDAKANSHDADRLDILATLVEAYEEKTDPIE
jgi:HTH-type transcriptional regulator / antitoxin HigA